jgi:uncharacterized Zn finger protein
MNVNLKVTREQIRQRASAKSFSGGESYFRSGAVYDKVRRENQLAARCRGSSGGPYRIQAAFDTLGNLLNTSCTCPYDYGGDCKHIVAMLLAFLDAPAAFEVRGSIEATLMERSKEELVALIKEMLQRAPELEILVNRPMPGKHRGPIDISSYRAELREVISSEDRWDYYDEGESVGSVVSSICKTASEFAEHGDWASTLAIYEVILQESLEASYDELVYDDEFWEAFNEVLEGIIDALAHSEVSSDDRLRKTALFALLNAEIWDVSMGGVGATDGVEIVETILQYARPDDIEKIRKVVEHARSQKSGKWASEYFNNLLLNLNVVDGADPETVLEWMLEQEMYRAGLGKLMELGRHEEAIKLVEDHLVQPYERLEAVKLLSTQGQDEAAVRLAEDTIKKEFYHGLVDWLLDQYQQQNNQEARFRILQRKLQERPSVETYQALKQAAQEVNRWEKTRPEIIQLLSKHTATLIRVYLFEQEWDAAWKALEDATKDRRAVYGIDLEVTDATRSTHPRKALEVYLKHARFNIDQRSRENYQQAAHQLASMKEIYSQLGEVAEWERLIASIKTDFKRLPALQDELRRAKL